MGILRKIVEKLDDVADKKIADVVEKAGVPPKREPAPKPVPKTELSVVALRLLRAAGFAGVVAVTASAALVGRCRR